MIAYIEGKITQKEPAFIVVEAGGIGYEVRISTTGKSISDFNTVFCSFKFSSSGFTG